MTTRVKTEETVINTPPNDKNVTILGAVHYFQEPPLGAIWMIPISAEEYEEDVDTNYSDFEGATELIGPVLPYDLAEEFEDALARVLEALGYKVHRGWETAD